MSHHADTGASHPLNGSRTSWNVSFYVFLTLSVMAVVVAPFGPAWLAMSICIALLFSAVPMFYLAAKRNTALGNR